MKKNDVFAAFTTNRRLLVILALFGLLLLSGCGMNQSTIDSSTPGLFNHYVIYPLSWCIQELASFLQGSYGLAVMAVTVIIRIVLLPLFLRQYRSQMAMRQKMSVLQPELKALQEKYKGKTDAESRQKLQQETMQLYSKHQVNPLAMGCLPMLIQLPILSGLYSAIKLTPEVASHSFLWFKLGSTDIVLPILAAVVYFVQFKVSQRTVDQKLTGPMAMMGFLSPIMMAVFAFSAPAAISLYWVTGGLFMIAQTLLMQRLYPVKGAAPIEAGGQAVVKTP
ncbi:YidC/Oxa1 family membrane protein insertase [Paenibacillus phyllosphaerae]|uniref:Membrane protein insertase YidC n=1 Tax=Paenibacillus phyllosphaerae TaxID=274593 RepID=A0A7W5B1P2_9BACL|nr:YidC/Oxa1 family membrane protein insertase [Paenibacillus phyllosphaerae]